jgi:hypothetical protein
VLGETSEAVVEEVGAGAAVVGAGALAQAQRTPERSAESAMRGRWSVIVARANAMAVNEMAGGHDAR